MVTSPRQRLLEWRDNRIHLVKIKRSQIIFECCYPDCDISLAWNLEVGDQRWADDLFRDSGWAMDRTGKMLCPTHSKVE
jgi:hypothetical protein